MIRPEMDLKKNVKSIHNLTYSELVEMLKVICDPNYDEDIQSFYLETIDATLPGGNVSDLIFWPNLWFADEDMLDVEMEPFEIADYLLAWTGISLTGSENRKLPEIPKSKRDGLPPVIHL